ncbi:MAG TPA: gas vesicle protein [Halococcus sp.]|nr:gas vesicle protein [Halococcus sp.]
MSSGGPARKSDSLADVVEMLLDKGVVVNADIVVSIGDTELLGVQLRAAIASFETAAEYGLEFPEGTDMRRVEAASGRTELEGDEETVAVENADDESIEDHESDTDSRSASELGSRPNTEAGASDGEESGEPADTETNGEEETDDGD